MARQIRIILLLVFMLTTFATYAGDKFGGTEGAKKIIEDEYLSALSASFEKAMEVRFNVSGKFTVIAAHRNYVVVSFLPRDKDIRGGGMHFVYDPILKKIVYVLGED